MSPVCARSVGGLDVMTLNGENVVFGPLPRLRRPTLPFITRPPRGQTEKSRKRESTVLGTRLDPSTVVLSHFSYSTQQDSNHNLPE